MNLNLKKKKDIQMDKIKSRNVNHRYSRNVNRRYPKNINHKQMRNANHKRMKRVNPKRGGNVNPKQMGNLNHRYIRNNKIRRKRILVQRSLLLGCIAIFLCIIWNVTKTHETQPSKVSNPLRTSQRPTNELKDVDPVEDKTPDLNLLQIVSLEHPLQQDVNIELSSLSNGEQIATLAYDPLMKMLSDGEKQGLSFIVCSGYRSISEQTKLFNNKLQRVQNEGHTESEAYDIAKQEVAVPGSSEHHLGLTADIVSVDYQILDDAQANTPEAKWLKENCAKYGFILRYPSEGTDVTGIIFEPWHYRYVGIEAAQEIMENNYTLEEYVEKIGVEQ